MYIWLGTFAKKAIVSGTSCELASYLLCGISTQFILCTRRINTEQGVTKWGILYCQ
jgi:hypothetical protein